MTSLVRSLSSLPALPLAWLAYAETKQKWDNMPLTPVQDHKTQSAHPYHPSMGQIMGQIREVVRPRSLPTWDLSA